MNTVDKQKPVRIAKSPNSVKLARGTAALRYFSYTVSRCHRKGTKRSKYLYQTFFFSKFAKHQSYIQIEGHHPQNSTHKNLAPCDMNL